MFKKLSDFIDDMLDRINRMGKYDPSVDEYRQAYQEYAASGSKKNIWRVLTRTQK